MRTKKCFYKSVWKEAREVPVKFHIKTIEGNVLPVTSARWKPPGAAWRNSALKQKLHILLYDCERTTFPKCETGDREALRRKDDRLTWRIWCLHVCHFQQLLTIFLSNDPCSEINHSASTVWKLKKKKESKEHKRLSYGVSGV